MRKINEVIIVEGKHDIAFLKTFLDADFIQTYGSSLPIETQTLITKLSSQGREFIILTDPDYPGTKIRNEVLKLVPTAKQGFVRKELSRTSKKVGVEHSSVEEVTRALENLISQSERESIFFKEDMQNFGLIGQSNSNVLRKKIGEFLGIGCANGKTFLKRINMLNMSREDMLNKIEEIINGKNCNN